VYFAPPESKIHAIVRQYTWKAFDDTTHLDNESITTLFIDHVEPSAFLDFEEKLSTHENVQATHSHSSIDNKVLDGLSAENK
jgi:hypothetical protein